MRKLATLILAGVLATAPLHAQNFNPLDLRNGYTAESQLVKDNLDLVTSALAGEVILQKIDKGYVGKKTSRYLAGNGWNELYDKLCKSADSLPDKLITNIESQNLLDSVYKSMNEVIWVEDDY